MCVLDEFEPRSLTYRAATQLSTSRSPQSYIYLSQNFLSKFKSQKQFIYFLYVINFTLLDFLLFSYPKQIVILRSIAGSYKSKYLLKSLFNGSDQGNTKVFASKHFSFLIIPISQQTVAEGMNLRPAFSRNVSVAVLINSRSQLDFLSSVLPPSQKSAQLIRKSRQRRAMGRWSQGRQSRRTLK